MVGGEVDGATVGDELLAQVGVAGTVTDVPLARGDDLEGLVALLEELHGVADRLGVADHFTGRLEQLHHGLFGAEHGFAGNGGVGRLGVVGDDDIGGVGDDAAVGAEDGAVGQRQFAPPDDVGDITEGTDHRDA